MAAAIRTVMTPWALVSSRPSRRHASAQIGAEGPRGRDRPMSGCRPGHGPRYPKKVSRLCTYPSSVLARMRRSKTIRVVLPPAPGYRRATARVAGDTAPCGYRCPDRARCPASGARTPARVEVGEQGHGQRGREEPLGVGELQEPPQIASRYCRSCGPSWYGPAPAAWQSRFSWPPSTGQGRGRPRPRDALSRVG